MSTLSERYHSELRSCRKVTDMFLLAMAITFGLIAVGDLLGDPVVSLLGLPGSLSIEEAQLVGSGEATVQELTGAPAFMAFASMYLIPIGNWIVFLLAMLAPPANRRMLRKMIFVRDGRSLALVCLCAFFDTVFGVEGSLGAVFLLLLVCAGLVVYAKRRGLRAPDLWAEDEARQAQA